MDHSVTLDVCVPLCTHVIVSHTAWDSEVPVWRVSGASHTVFWFESVVKCSRNTFSVLLMLLTLSRPYTVIRHLKTRTLLSFQKSVSLFSSAALQIVCFVQHKNVQLPLHYGWMNDRLEGGTDVL